MLSYLEKSWQKRKEENHSWYDYGKLPVGSVDYSVGKDDLNTHGKLPEIIHISDRWVVNKISVILLSHRSNFFTVVP